MLLSQETVIVVVWVVVSLGSFSIINEKLFAERIILDWSGSTCSQVEFGLKHILINKRKIYYFI